MFGISLLAVVLWALRKLALWYWKINDLVSNQNRVIELLEEIRDGMQKGSE